MWLRRHRVRGRRWFTWHFGVLRFGLPVSVAWTLLLATAGPFVLSRFLLHLASNAVAGVIGGYIAGRVTWKLLVETRRRRSPRTPAGPRAH